MAKKADLEAREAECAGPQDYAALAKEALQAPADPDYAKHLLQQGEMQCQFPADYIRIAEVAVAAGESELSDGLYEKAEEFCMEGKEYAEVANSLAAHSGKKDKARELLEKAVSQASQPEEILTYAGYAKTGFEDESLAASLLAKVTDALKELADFQALAKKLVEEQGNAEKARMLYDQAAGLAGDPAGTVEYATGLVELFEDKERAEELLAAVEGDCMFPGQFVALAEGYKTLLDNTDKVSELLEQGKQFAMSGEENLDLANGYARLLGDQKTASELYGQALNDLVAKDDLLRLAGDMAENLEDKAQATQAYEKAETKITDPNDLAVLAKEVKTRLGDTTMAASIFERAAEKIDQPNDLLRLGKQVFEILADAKQARAVYDKFLGAASDYPQLQRLLDVLAGDFEDQELARHATDKALEINESTLSLLDLAKRAQGLLSDGALTAQVLGKAEEAVQSLDEMKQLSSAVNELAGDDKERLERVAAKLEKREASEAKYRTFQEREKQMTRFAELASLAEEVVDELEDKFYAAQLLEKAQEMLDSGPFSLQQYQSLILAVDRLIGDTDWVKRLLDASAEKVGYFMQVRALGRTAAVELGDREFGATWTRTLYESWEKRMQAAESVSSHEVGKLARAVDEDLADRKWALTLLDKARERAQSHLDHAWLGYHARSWGDSEVADSCYREAAGKCGNAMQFGQLVSQLRSFGESLQLQRELYGIGEKALTDPTSKLRWAEGIVRELGDLEWAKRIYDELEGPFREAARSSVLNNSRNTWLQAKRS